MTKPSGSRAVGRPRSPEAERAIIRTTLEMMADGRTIDSLSMCAIARCAGVGKATIYRRWSTKEELVVDAISHLEEPVEIPSSGCIRDDLIQVLASLRDWATASPSARALPALLSGRRDFPELVARYLQIVVEPRLRLVRGVLVRGVREGRLRPGTDSELTLMALFGPVFSLLALQVHTGRQAPIDIGLPAEFPDRFVDAILAGIAVA